MAAVFTFVSVGYLHNGQEEVISLEQMQKHCRDVRVLDLLADLAILCEDVVERRVPTERLSIPDRQRMGADVTQESLEAEFPGWETWLGVDNRWCARVKGAEPPVLVQVDDLEGLREEIIRKLSRTQEYWEAQAQSSGR